MYKAYNLVTNIFIATAYVFPFFLLFLQDKQLLISVFSPAYQFLWSLLLFAYHPSLFSAPLPLE